MEDFKVVFDLENSLRYLLKATYLINIHFMKQLSHNRSSPAIFKMWSAIFL